MSLFYDKGKYMNSIDINSSKLKQNNNNPINKLNLPKNSNKKNRLQTTLFNEYIRASPFDNNNMKKKQFLTTFQNYKEMKNYQTNINNNSKIVNEKIPQNKKMNFNISFEGNFGRNNFSKNLDLTKEGIFKGKNNENKKSMNNSMIINHKNKIKNKNLKNNKSLSINTQNTLNYKRNNLDENLLIKKLEEKFKSLENNIIDKNYENEIDHEEMIISALKTNDFPTNKKIKNLIKNNTPSYKLSKITDDNTINHKNEDDHFTKLIMDKVLLNNQFNFDDDYLLNSSFENNRNDFNIMYTDNYGESVMNDMLSLEIKLLIEKILEIQKSYHKELDLIMLQNNLNSKTLKLLVQQIKYFQKKIFLMKKMKENKEMSRNLNYGFDKNNHNNQHDICKINKNEFNLWNYILYEQKEKNDEENKEKVKKIFKKIVFERYSKIKEKLNNLENKIIITLMNKYNYSPKTKKSVKSNNKNIISFSPNQWKNKNTNIINRQKKLSNINNINNKKRHKKTSSCVQTKPNKYTYFKNNQKIK